MRNEYYADSRDVFKWSVIAELSEKLGIKTVLQVTMLRPDLNLGEGKTRHKPIYSKAIIDSFFIEERKLEPDFRRIRKLPDKCKLKFDVEVIEDRFYSTDNKPYRKKYFKKAIETVRSIENPKLIFLDPDTGLSFNDKPNPKQIGKAEIKRLYSELSNEDILLIYQHGLHELPPWWQKPESIVKSVISENHRVITVPDVDIAFIAVIPAATKDDLLDFPS